MTASMTRNVFVSYAWKDGSKVARWLHDRFNREQGWSAWMDVSLHADTVFNHELQNRLTNCDIVVVVVSPDVNRPDTPSFVQKELYFATQPEVNKPVFAARVTACAIPLIIAGYTYVDFYPEDVFESAFQDLLSKIGKSAERDAMIPTVSEMTDTARQDRELAYLREVARKHTFWSKVYIDAAASAEIKPQADPDSPAPDPDIASFLAELSMEVATDKGFTEDRDQTHEVQSFDALTDALGQFDRVAIIGAPGGGKTTTLKRFAHQLAQVAADTLNDDDDLTQDTPLPIFVPLGAFTGGDLTQYIQAQFTNLPLSDYLPDRAVILLDGLNETAHKNMPDVERWLNANPNVRVMLSCRTLDYIERQLPLQRVDVQPLDVQRIWQFMRAYQLHDHDRETLLFGLMGEQWVTLWGKFKDKELGFDDFWFGKEIGLGHAIYYVTTSNTKNLYNALRDMLDAGNHDYPGLLGLVRNPFLLTLTIALYSQTRTIPANRAQLFDRFVAQLFEKRGKVAADTQQIEWIDEDIQRKALAELAYRMTDEASATAVPLEWAIHSIEKALPDQNGDYLLYLVASASIIEKGSEVRFTHQLLQEFFAAYRVQMDIENGVTAHKYFPSDNWQEQTGWEETMILLAGMTGDATDVVRWLTPVQPDLAFRCVKESGAPCEQHAIDALYQPADKARRSPIARAEWGRDIASNDTRKGVGVKILPSPSEVVERGVGGEGINIPDIDWVTVPAGEFQYQDEAQPRYLEAFDISRYPITFSQFQTFVDAPDGLNSPNHDWFEGLGGNASQYEMREQRWKYNNHPRDTVKWYQAMAFCRWLSYKLGGGYAIDAIDTWVVRLPTEYEWEKAARYPDGRQYAWGNEYQTGMANINEVGNEAGSYNLGQTTAVGIYPPNPLGIYDLNGNVWEWCLSDYKNPAEHPTGEDLRTSNTRVLRGGAFVSDQRYSRAAYRLGYLPSIRNVSFGIRVVLSPILKAVDR